jgi:aminopeptidase N
VRFRHEAGRVELEIEQAQVDKDAGVPVFAFDLDVTFEAQGGVTERTVRVEEQRTVVSFPMEAPPEVIRIDPAGKVLHELDFDPGEDLLSKQLAARDVRGRIQAGEGLIRTGKRRHIERIGKLFEAEPYWGVRVEWAKALGKVQTEAALEVLVELAERHDDPQSLPALLEALGQYRDSRVTSRLEARLDAGLAPRASEAVYDALGAQREAAPLQRLSEASAHRSVGAFAQAAALRALAGTRREEAVSLLLDRARTADPRVRGVAAQALGTLAKQLERRARERAVEALTDLLRADDARLRAGAAKGLVAAGAREAVPALEAYRATLPHQEAVVLDQGIAELRQGDGDLRKLHKTVEELETRVRRLRERADALERRLEQE